jgi:hypothetical protein
MSDPSSETTVEGAISMSSREADSKLGESPPDPSTIGPGHNVSFGKYVGVFGTV